MYQCILHINEVLLKKYDFKKKFPYKVMCNSFIEIAIKLKYNQIVIEFLRKYLPLIPNLKVKRLLRKNGFTFNTISFLLLRKSQLFDKNYPKVSRILQLNPYEDMEDLLEKDFNFSLFEYGLSIATPCYQSLGDGNYWLRHINTPTFR